MAQPSPGDVPSGCVPGHSRTKSLGPLARGGEGRTRLSEALETPEIRELAQLPHQCPLLPARHVTATREARGVAESVAHTGKPVPAAGQINRSSRPPRVSQQQHCQVQREARETKRKEEAMGSPALHPPGRVSSVKSIPCLGLGFLIWKKPSILPAWSRHPEVALYEITVFQHS